MQRCTLSLGSGGQRHLEVAPLGSVNDLYDQPLLLEADLSVYLQLGLQPPALTPSP